MNILFVHRHFPGQFRSLAPALVDRGHTVVAMTMEDREMEHWRGILLVPSKPVAEPTPGIHKWAAKFEREMIFAETGMVTAQQLQASGFTPDLIIAHPAWGESLLLKQVWPTAKLGIYCEFYHPIVGGDADFDPEFSFAGPEFAGGVQIGHANDLLHFDIADAGLSPTQWQASTYPPSFRDKITVVHEGIDTQLIKPSDEASITLNGSLTLTPKDEIVTFVARNFEPHRGYHTFIRALPGLLKQRPNARIVLIGGDGSAYGPTRQDGMSWKQYFVAEVVDQISEADWQRVHFMGSLPHHQMLTFLQLASVHVYLTYPFVLSWSLLEAMSAGCAVVASDTAPVREVITDGQTGRLVNFFDPAALASTIAGLLADPDASARLGRSARDYAVEHFDMASVCLPQQLAWVENLFHDESRGR